VLRGACVRKTRPEDRRFRSGAGYVSTLLTSCFVVPQCRWHDLLRLDNIIGLWGSLWLVLDSHPSLSKTCAANWSTLTTDSASSSKRATVPSQHCGGLHKLAVSVPICRPWPQPCADNKILVRVLCVALVIWLAKMGCAFRDSTTY
jgi:hypothetical protein